MVINYEVNLVISNDIYKEYYEWLVHHIKIILTYEGFKKAIIHKLCDTVDEANKHITVVYSIATKKDLDNYLINHATEMRNDGIQKFGNKFSATRRILEPIDMLELSK